MTYDPITTFRVQVEIGRVVPSGPAECWQWLGQTDRDGYGRLNGSLAHRLAYVAWVGPIPDGATLDHLCHTRDPSCRAGTACSHRKCVNPAHLEPVAAAINIERAHVQEICKWGHPFDDANTRVSWVDPPRGGSQWRRRACRACDRRRAAEYKARRLRRLAGGSEEVAA